MFIALLLALFVTRFLQRQRLVVDEPAGASDAAQLPLLLAAGHQFEFEGLEALHGSIIVWLMSDGNEIRHGRHCVFKMNVHLVFVTKYRRRVFDDDAINRLRTIFAKVCTDFKAQLIEMDGGDDHVHRLVAYPPTVAVSNLVNSLKGVSSRLLRLARPDIQKRSWKGALWSSSYFASSCGGAPISIMRPYIEQQQTPHGKRAEGEGSTKPKTRTATPSALSFPALNGGACRAPGHWIRQELNDVIAKTVAALPKGGRTTFLHLATCVACISPPLSSDEEGNGFSWLLAVAGLTGDDLPFSSPDVWGRGRHRRVTDRFRA